MSRYCSIEGGASEGTSNSHADGMYSSFNKERRVVLVRKRQGDQTLHPLFRKQLEALPSNTHAYNFVLVVFSLHHRTCCGLSMYQVCTSTVLRSDATSLVLFPAHTRTDVCEDGGTTATSTINELTQIWRFYVAKARAILLPRSQEAHPTKNRWRRTGIRN